MDQIKQILSQKGMTELVNYINGIENPSLDYTSVIRMFNDLDLDKAIELLKTKIIHNGQAAERLAAAAEAKAAASASNPATSSAPSSNQAAPTRASAPAPAPSILYIFHPTLSDGQPIEFEQTIPRQGVVLNKVTMLSSMDEGKTYTISEMEHNSKDPYPKINYHVIKEPNVVEEV